MKIALATDHGGFEQLKELKPYIESLGYECIDFGPKELDPEDDYPDFILPAARSVASGECQLGIVLGRSGQGEAMTANKIKGVRCALYYGPAKAIEAVDASGQSATDEYELVRKTREHNDANMLSLAGSYVSVDEMKKVTKMWLDSKFSGAQRHERRHQKMDAES